jgi:hypothetical protein
MPKVYVLPAAIKPPPATWGLARPVTDAGACGQDRRPLHVGQQLGLGHIEQAQLQLLAELEIGDEPVDAAPECLQRLQGWMVQDPAHLLGRGRIDRRDVLRLEGSRFGDDMGRHDPLNERLDVGARRCPHAGLRRARGSGAQQPFE